MSPSFYNPVTNTQINIIGTTNFKRILNIYPKIVSPKFVFHNDFMHHPAIKHIKSVLNGNKILDVA